MGIIKVHANFGREAESWPWGEGGTLFVSWTKFIDARLAELRVQGHTTRVCGFVWHQEIDDVIHGRLAAVMESFFATLKKELIHHERDKIGGSVEHLRIHRGERASSFMILLRTMLTSVGVDGDVVLQDHTLPRF